MNTHVNLNLGKGAGLRGCINREQQDAVQQLFETNGWPWNAEVTDVEMKAQHCPCHQTSVLHDMTVTYILNVENKFITSAPSVPTFSTFLLKLWLMGTVFVTPACN